MMKKKTAPKSTPKYYVPALEKSLDILEALAVAAVPQSLSELATTLARTPSELFRMLDALEKRSYIARDTVSDGYHLTLKLYELAHTHSPVDHLLKAASLPMRKLAEAIHESCHLSVLANQKLMVIAQAESPEPVRLSVEVGYQTPALSTASGRLMVAYLAEEERVQFIETDPFFAQMSSPQRVEMLRDLIAIPGKGFHIANSSRRTGLDVSCLVGNPKIGVIAALGVPFIPGGANEGKEHKLVPAIQKCADEITLALGLNQAKTGADKE